MNGFSALWRAGFGIPHKTVTSDAKNARFSALWRAGFGILKDYLENIEWDGVSVLSGEPVLEFQ